MESRDELERWIAGTRQVQKKLKLGLAVGVPASIVLLVISRPAGGIAIAIVALVALAGFWITGGHIQDWEAKLYKLDHPEPKQLGRGRYQRE